MWCFWTRPDRKRAEACEARLARLIDSLDEAADVLHGRILQELDVYAERTGAERCQWAADLAYDVIYGWAAEVSRAARTP